jgi:hypothetical protein
MDKCMHAWKYDLDYGNEKFRKKNNLIIGSCWEPGLGYSRRQTSVGKNQLIFTGNHLLSEHWALITEERTPLLTFGLFKADKSITCRLHLIISDAWVTVLPFGVRPFQPSRMNSNLMPLVASVAASLNVIARLWIAYNASVNWSRKRLSELEASENGFTFSGYVLWTYPECIWNCVAVTMMNSTQ